MVKKLFLLLVVTVMVLLSGCTAAGRDTHLKIAALPIQDTLPLYVAQQNGYFDSAGIQVELIPVKSAQERDVLIHTGKADGVITDLIAVGLSNKNGIQMKAVSVALQATRDTPIFRVLSAPGSDIKSPSDLRGTPVGISRNTIIEYLTYRILEASGLKDADIATTEVSAIPLRFELLMKGQVKAATLPDPLAQAAMHNGANLVADDSVRPDISMSVLAFSADSLKKKPGTVKNFLEAWDMAVSELDAHPEKYQDLLITKGRVPKSVQGSYHMPPFPKPRAPSEAQVQNAVSWMVQKGLLNHALPYREMVDGSFLPGK